ncbi:MAG TPA: YceI family protein [Saprospiraceae bacterium]|nr:YceI family protein [Saprospiraceae bacterium]HMQ81270.1 YceI family protein [Saprospiraceae bacterium]
MNGLLLLCIHLIIAQPGEGTTYLIKNGKVSFRSDAPLELIEASSGKLNGVVDLSKNTFAFTIDINSFEGFNSPLQKEHFNENYLESRKYKTATYLGKMIEKPDFTQDGDYIIRTKGVLTIHGVAQERIIKNEVNVEGNKMTIRSNFTVLLEEHDISIPKIVHQKIAEEIEVSIVAVAEKQ